MRIEIRVWFQKLSSAEKWFLAAAAAGLAILALTAAAAGLRDIVLTGELVGSVVCASDDVPLDTGERQSSWGRWKNACVVQYSAGGKTMAVNTDRNGFYRFKDVPIGQDIYVQAVSASNRRLRDGKWQIASYTPSRAYWVGKIEAPGLAGLLSWEPLKLTAPTIKMPPDRSKAVTLGGPEE
ncbi:MAG: hypothetical protein OXT69_03685 [Candidatus Poribacteria bacterium]|nr:hypothetical protein [Candidatus Poribacteria bacterium]